MPLGKAASGRFALEANDLGVKTLTLTFRQAGATARFTGIDNVTTVSCQPNTWQEGQVIARKPTKRLPLQLHLPDAPVFSSGGWAAENTFALRLCYAETPQVLSITLTFAPDGLSFRGSVAVAFESGTAHPFNGRRS